MLERRAADTLRTGATLRRAREAATRADSSLAELQRATADAPRAVAAPSVPRDPRIASLNTAINAALDARSSAAFLALANNPAISAGPRVRALADTLESAAQALEASPLTATEERSQQQLTVRRLGNTIIAIAQFRRDALVASSGDTAVPRPADTSVRVATDSVALDEAVRLVATTRDSAEAAQRAYDAAQSALAAGASAMRAGTENGKLSPGLILLALLIAGLALRFAMALSREAQSPRLAHIGEAEAAVGAPTLAVVRDALPDGPMRFRPSGVDPFRVLYLGLTSTGTRARTLIVTGSDPIVIGAVGARLAIAAAADHRTTLVMDVDPEQIALARIFRAPPEPGYTDAMAGAFKWKEVARPVGSSDGLSITMISAGTTRDPIEENETTQAIRTEYGKFRDGFEFTILVSPLRDIANALALVPAAPIVLCGSLGVSDVTTFEKEGGDVNATGQRLHGVVLWDAPVPSLPSRAELAAHLSKQKGRTPGGSFQAVRKIVGPPFGDSKKP
jgi:Mrp family chromosome partitioning ATPase